MGHDPIHNHLEAHAHSEDGENGKIGLDCWHLVHDFSTCLLDGPNDHDGGGFGGCRGRGGSLSRFRHLCARCKTWCLGSGLKRCRSLPNDGTQGWQLPDYVHADVRRDAGGRSCRLKFSVLFVCNGEKLNSSTTHSARRTPL